MAVSGKNYRNHLLHADIVLNEKIDELTWLGDDKSSLISVINVYNTLSYKFWPEKVVGWRNQLWKWSCPLKLKLFIWLLLEDKILTWKNLQRRGWSGLGICFMCRSNEESSQHLFVSCPFTILIWKKVKLSLKLENGWNEDKFLECFQNWYFQNNLIRELAAFIFWFIWKDRNKKLFEE